MSLIKYNYEMVQWNSVPLCVFRFHKGRINGVCWLCNYTQVHIYGFTPLPNLEDLRKPRGMGLSLWVCTIKQVHISSKQLLKLFQCCITCYCINILNVGSDHNNKTIKIQRGGPIIYRTWVQGVGSRNMH